MNDFGSLSGLAGALILGPVAGSFLGVLVVRLPEGRPVVRSRSACPACGMRLGALDLVPLVSWVASRGRCRHCAAPIAPFYPLIEVAATGIALWGWTVADGWIVVAHWLLGWILLALTLIDHRDGTLPNALVLPLIPAGLIVIGLAVPSALIDHAVGAALGFGAFWAIQHGYRAWRGRDGLGGGDVKLMAAAGAWVGWAGMPGVVLIAALSALVLVVARTIGGGTVTATTRIAFGPFLCLGIWLVWLYGPPDLLALAARIGDAAFLV